MPTERTERTESEIKIILGKDGDERLRGRLGRPVRKLRQVNYYYDTPEDRLTRAGVSLRLRDEAVVGTGDETDDGTDEATEDVARDVTDERKFLLTVKETGLRAGALMVRPEFESEIDEKLMRAIRGGSVQFAELDLPPIHRLREAVEGFAGLTLAELGSVENLRDVFGFEHESGSLEILLDRTTFPDGSEEFELECELPGALAAQGARILRGLFDDLGIDWRPSEAGKYARFRRRIGRAAADASD